MKRKRRPRPFGTLEKQLELLGWSYIDLAKALDVVPSTAHNKLTGQTPWLLDEAIRAKEALGWQGTVEELFQIRI